MREDELEAAGARVGHFSYWTEQVERPPFDPPDDVVCQVIAFESHSAAGAFVTSLEAGPEALATTGIAWLPGDATVDELPASPGSNDGIRTFTMSAEGQGRSVGLAVMVWASGPNVVSVYAGNQESGADVDLARHVAAGMLARLDPELATDRE